MEITLRFQVKIRVHMPVIEIENLTKDFRLGFWRKRPFRALDGISLSVEAGEVFGFLGPNGAGKTTTLKILMNLIRPTSGTAKILGRPVDSVSMHRRIGYLPENPYFYDYLTPQEFLTYVGKLFGLGGAKLEQKVDSLLETVGLQGERAIALRKFSKGMVQRIGIAQALINDPEVVFLDEPMSGLDPLGRREVREVIHALKRNGVTIFFSSHILPDVEALCDRVAIMNKGRLLTLGTLDEILKLRIEGHEIILGGGKALSLEELRRRSGQVRQMGDRVHVSASDSRQVHDILTYALGCGAELISVQPIRPSLEDHFLTEVQRSG
jgi:ABC-2 type transport system ATP-binding protein